MRSGLLGGRKRGTTPLWLDAIIKKGSYPFFG